jgi:XTP/dITP diphosphohydrolase
MAELLVASTNPGKRKEMRALLDITGLTLVDPTMMGIQHEVEETGVSYADNARLKASEFARISGMWTIADDSGLEVDALNGSPGPLSARLGDPTFSDAERRRMLLDMLHSFPQPWLARFRCVAALSSPAGEVDLAEGICLGEVIPFERGTGGFGYDPIFLVHGTDYTMAELSLEKKNKLSHRARAIKSLLPIIKQRMGL